MRYEEFKSEVIRTSYAGEVRKRIYVPRLEVTYNIEYIRNVIFAEHFDEKMQSAYLDRYSYNNLGKSDNIIEFLNSKYLNDLSWNTLRLFNNVDFANVRMVILNQEGDLKISVIHSYSVLNNRLICCDPSDPAIGFGSMATAGNGIFVK